MADRRQHPGRINNNTWIHYIPHDPTNSTVSCGLLGAVDAVAISTGVLGPGTFVLPAGYRPPAAAYPEFWMLDD